MNRSSPFKRTARRHSARQKSNSLELSVELSKLWFYQGKKQQHSNSESKFSDQTQDGEKGCTERACCFDPNSKQQFLSSPHPQLFSHFLFPDVSRSYLLVPLALVLHASFVPDSDGGSLLVRVLSPPLTSKSPLASYLKKQKDSNSTASPTSSSLRQRLRTYLEGPLQNLRLVKIEARLSDKTSTGAEGLSWSSKVMSLSYSSLNVKPFRRLKVLINPVGGQGKSVELFEKKVRPILEASGCKMSIELTKYRNHGFEIARDLDLTKFDILVCVSGDGMLHEIINGFSKRKDSRDAFRKILLAPIPTGSGNAASVNLLGVKNGFSLSVGCLNIVKGRGLKVDLCCITQPQSIAQLSSSEINDIPKNGVAGEDSTTQELDPQASETIPKLPYNQYYSFLSQAIGLFADLDLGTDDMRALGDSRFLIGFFSGVLKNGICEVDVDVKFGEGGSSNRKEMREKFKKFKWEEMEESKDEDDDEVEVEEVEGEVGEGEDQVKKDSSGMPNFRHGSAIDDLGDLPSTNFKDPSWPSTHTASASSDSPNKEWTRINIPLASLYAGKLPYVSRDLLQFPYSIPGQGLLDLAVTSDSSRISKIKGISAAESGQVIFHPSVIYLQVEAFRVTPRFKEGDKRLKKGGLISIDGEKVPYSSFQVEVVKGVNMRLMSLYGEMITPDVKPENGEWDE